MQEASTLNSTCFYTDYNFDNNKHRILREMLSEDFSRKNCKKETNQMHSLICFHSPRNNIPPPTIINSSEKKMYFEKEKVKMRSLLFKEDLVKLTHKWLSVKSKIHCINCNVIKIKYFCLINRKWKAINIFRDFLFLISSKASNYWGRL